MAVSKPSLLSSMFQGTVALGEKAVSSDGYFEIEGHEGLSLLIKQFPWPERTVAGEIEVPMPLGTAMWQSQQVKINIQGPVTLMETVSGHVAKLLEDVINNGGYFNAKVYEGVPENYTRVARLQRCFFVMDTPDRDYENRSAILQISGNLHAHFFGYDE